MRGMRNPSPKKIGEANIRDVENVLFNLYKRMTSHVDFVFTEDMALTSLIKPEDLEFVKRSASLYNHMRSSYYGASAMQIVAPAYANDRIFLVFTRNTSFVPPGYLVGKQEINKVNPAFIETIKPWLEQVVPLREMYLTAQQAWNELTRLTDYDYARIRALWPTIDALAPVIGRVVPKMPNPKGLPSPSPELREKLNVAETFINAALMMPEKQYETDTPIRIALGDRDWR